VDEKRTSFVAIMVIITRAPTITLTRADACAAYFAPIAERDPMRFPTRAEAATPMPKGMVFKTEGT
jgi:hypothetical protein